MQKYVEQKMKLLRKAEPLIWDSEEIRQKSMGTMYALNRIFYGDDVEELIDFQEELAENRIQDDYHLIRVIASLNELYFIREKFIEGVK